MNETPWIPPAITATVLPFGSSVTTPITIASSSGAAHAGPTCHTCGTPYVGIHSCSIEQLLEAAERAEERAKGLRALALRRFEALSPVETRGPRDHAEDDMTAEEFDQAFADGEQVDLDVKWIRRRRPPWADEK